MLIGAKWLGGLFEEEIRRIERIRAAEEIDRLREESKTKWNGVEEIRRLRESH